MASNDSVRLLSSTLLSVRGAATATRSSPGGGLVLRFLFPPEAGDADWLRRLPCSAGLGRLLLGGEPGGSCARECASAELLMRLTSSSAASNLGPGSDGTDSPLGTFRLDSLGGPTAGLASASACGCEARAACPGACSGPVVSPWLPLWPLLEMTRWGCAYFSVWTLDDRWRDAAGDAAGRESARSSAEPLWSRESQRTASCGHKYNIYNIII